MIINDDKVITFFTFPFDFYYLVRLQILFVTTYESNDV